MHQTDLADRLLVPRPTKPWGLATRVIGDIQTFYSDSLLPQDGLRCWHSIGFIFLQTRCFMGLVTHVLRRSEHGDRRVEG